MVQVPTPVSVTVASLTLHGPPALNTTGLPDAPPLTPVSAKGAAPMIRSGRAGKVMLCGVDGAEASWTVCPLLSEPVLESYSPGSGANAAVMVCEPTARLEVAQCALLE